MGKRDHPRHQFSPARARLVAAFNRFVLKRPNLLFVLSQHGCKIEVAVEIVVGDWNVNSAGQRHQTTVAESLLAVILEPEDFAMHETENRDRQIKVAIAIEVGGLYVGHAPKIIEKSMPLEHHVVELLKPDDGADSLVGRPDVPKDRDKHVVVAILIEIDNGRMGGRRQQGVSKRLRIPFALGCLLIPNDLLSLRIAGDDVNVFVLSLADGVERRLTATRSESPRWSPDGGRIAFGGSRWYEGGIFVIGADGTGERRLTESGWWPIWWPDGQRIAFLDRASGGGYDKASAQEIRSVAVCGGPTELVAEIDFSTGNQPFDISPDGDQIVYTNSFPVSSEIWLLQPPESR